MFRDRFRVAGYTTRNPLELFRDSGPYAVNDTEAQGEKLNSKP